MKRFEGRMAVVTGAGGTIGSVVCSRLVEEGAKVLAVDVDESAAKATAASLGEAVTPLRLKTVAANVFTHPEIATVGVGFEAVTSGRVPARTVTLPLATNARAKMQGHRDGFVKIYCRPATGVVVGAVVVAPDASELIFPLTLAVQRTLTIADLAATIGVYPSLSGSIAEAARQLMLHDDLD